MKKKLPFFVLGLLISVAVGTAQGQRSLTVDDEINRVRVSTPAISPDGTRVVFVQSDLNWEKNKRETSLYMVPAAGGEPMRFTSGPSDRSPRWSPDGKYLAFVRATASTVKEESEDEEDRERKPKKKPQIWAMRAAGGEAFQLTDLSEGIKTFRWAPSSDRIVFTADDPKSEEERKKLKKGADTIYVFEGPNGQYRGSWSNIWVVGVEDRKPKQVTHEKMLVSDIDVSPEGDRVAFIYRRENARNQGNLAEVAMARLDDGKLVRLTENEAPESRVKWNPNGREIGYLAPDDKSWALREDKLFVLDVESRQYRITSGGFEGAILSYAWYPDGGSVAMAAGVRTNRGIYKLDVRSDGVSALTDQPGSVADVSFTPDRSKTAFVWSDALTPPDVYFSSLAAGSHPQRLTDLNPGLREMALGSVKVVDWKSDDGLPIEGLLYLPPGYREGRRVPLILQIHGGPAGVYTSSWIGERLIFSGLGYAMLCPNVRGSSAYGDELLRGNMNDIGGGDYQDLMSGVDQLIADGIVDPDKMGVRGWSYGGILGGWTITQTDRFKAASLGAMVADWTSEYGQGFNHDVRLWYIGGDPWSNPEGYREMSPLTHASKVTTPTILLHGEVDITDTIEQTMNFFNALWEKGIPTRFLRFPREPHGLQEPRHQRTRLVEEIAWMQKFILGVEWTDEREEEDEQVPTETPTRHQR
jgi:dipeptidyl aminopeptidase/acylaminoacyl peptidase